MNAAAHLLSTHPWRHDNAAGQDAMKTAIEACLP
jgi:hypothetical protein